MTTPLADRHLLVLYDADCGICSRSARLLHRLDRGRRLRLVPLQDAHEIVDAPPMGILLAAIHVRDRDGRWSIAGAAWIRIAEEVTLLRPVAVVARVSAIRIGIELVYALVARNRHRISHILGDQACAVGSRNPGHRRASRKRTGRGAALANSGADDELVPRVMMIRAEPSPYYSKAPAAREHARKMLREASHRRCMM